MHTTIHDLESSTHLSTKYLEKEKILNKEHKQIHSRLIVARALHTLLEVAYEKSLKDIETGHWNHVKRCKLEAVEKICSETTDIDLQTVSDLCFYYGVTLRMDMNEKV